MLENIDVLPYGNDPFFWSDYAELRAIVHPDKCFSRGDLAGIANRSVAGGPAINVEEQWRSLIDFCGIRTHEFGESYPFQVSEDSDTLLFEFDNTPQKRLYLGLLISSSMRYLKNTRKNDIARDFELACFAVFSKLMPVGSEIRATWAGGGPEAPYVGHLYEKMIKIASDIRGEPNIKPNHFKANNSGDGGIDLIAWHPMGDERKGIPISFAQCGCSRNDWTFKQAEASPFLHRTKFNVQHEWATYYFMPIDLREFNGDWAYESKIGSVIIVDRLRMVRLANQYAIHDALPPLDFVDEAMALLEA